MNVPSISIELREIHQSNMEQRRLRELDTRNYREHRLDSLRERTNDSDIDSVEIEGDGI